jgi:hypothetical protein
MTCSGCESVIRDGQMLASASLTILRVKRWGYFSLSLWSMPFSYATRICNSELRPSRTRSYGLGQAHGHRFNRPIRHTRHDSFHFPEGRLGSFVKDDHRQLRECALAWIVFLKRGKMLAVWPNCTKFQAAILLSGRGFEKRFLHVTVHRLAQL